MAPTITAGLSQSVIMMDVQRKAKINTRSIISTREDGFLNS